VDLPFEIIDSHVHISGRVRAMSDEMEKSRCKGLNICFSPATEKDEPSGLDGRIREAAEAYRESKGRLPWATTFDARPFEHSDFLDRTLAGLHWSFDHGAVGVKMWKNIGMGILSRDGQYVMPDNPAYTPICEAIAKAGKTLLTHIAEPAGAWMAINASNPEHLYYKDNPKWHMYERADAPDKQSLLAARDCILMRHPTLRVIGCHLGSQEDDLAQLAARLDNFPAFAVDTSARISYLVRQDRETVRQFLIKYQDRVLHGSDLILSADTGSKAAAIFLRWQEQTWKFFSTSGVMPSPNGPVQALDLPENVARKIFHDNAIRWLPGIHPDS